MKWLILLLLPLTAWAQEDLQSPSGPGDYRSGFFAADLRGLADTPYQDWIDPGNEFCRVAHKANCDSSTATSEQLSGALATWQAMSKCNRLRLRLFHKSRLKYEHGTMAKVWVMYNTGLPVSLKDEAKLCLDPGTFEYLGDTFSSARTKIVNRTSQAFFEGFFPQNRMTTVILGWESDAQ